MGSLGPSRPALIGYVMVTRQWHTSLANSLQGYPARGPARRVTRTARTPAALRWPSQRLAVSQCRAGRGGSESLKSHVALNLRSVTEAITIKISPPTVTVGYKLVAGWPRHATATLTSESRFAGARETGRLGTDRHPMIMRLGGSADFRRLEPGV